MTFLEQVCSSVGEWVKNTQFNDAYVFGSLIHKRGTQFDRQISDVDLACNFMQPESYLTRWKTVTEAVDPTVDLNLKLLSLFGRNDASEAIVSVVPASQYELARGVHKDKSPEFFSHNSFCHVDTHVKGAIGKSYRITSPITDGAMDALREAQRYRNKILSISPSGIKSVEDYNGTDVMPKLLARCAAQVRWAREKNPLKDQRFDVNEGQVYVLQLLTARRNEVSAVESLFQRVTIRMNGRGTAGPLTPSDQMLLWEILADDMMAMQPVVEGPVKLRRGTKKTRPRVPTPKIRAAALERAGYRCSFPDCEVPLGEGGIGEIAHILSSSPNGPRFDPEWPNDKINDLDNLVVLCPTHHRLIDTKPDEYTAKTIRRWNKMKENRVSAFSAENLLTIVRLINKLI